MREYSRHEIAEALGISVAAAKARLFHARAALRRAAELKARRSVELMRSSFRIRG
jgi:DNA-directed RNA polymerase specialized sigma24 family protein